MQKSEKQQGNKATIFLGIAVLIELAFLSFTVFQGSGKNIILYMSVYAFTFILFMIAYFIIRNRTIKFGNKIILKASKAFNTEPVLFVIIFFALLYRITLIPAEPSTSDDVYRYIWEGKILANGFNPFEKTPDDPELNFLHSDNLPGKVTFPSMTSIYPTVAQAVFLFNYLVSGESDWGMKLIYLLCEFITFVFLIKIFELRKQNRNLVILYAWLPLPIMEYFINSHIDAVGIMFFIVFIFLILSGKYIQAAFTFALTVITKLIPVIIAPLLIKKLGWKKSFYFSAVFLITAAVLLYPIIPETRAINESFFTYLQNWSFNGSVYSLLNGIFRNGYLAREISSVLFVITLGIISIKYSDFLKAAYSVFIAFTVFAATLYPWYLGYLAALNPFFGFYSVLSLFFTINLTNLSPLADVWTEYTWVYIVEYVPFYFLLSIELMFLIQKRKTIGKK